MKVEEFIDILGADFYTGVPDSQLKALCNYLTDTYGIDKQHHLIAANEGNCAALAAGYHLATGKVPVVYMQNSGEGNIINPLASLLNDNVYAIPTIFVIGWRGEPGVHDEPQHIFQGKVTVKLMEDMEVATFVISKETSTEELQECKNAFDKLLANGKQVAFVVRKGALEYDGKPVYANEYRLIREDVVKAVAKAAGEDVIVSTTGKASRELFEAREAEGQSHKYDFLTVGSMGHASSIALGVAINNPHTKVWCIDGDGAALMHLGAMALIGDSKQENLVHIVINNEAHETVGGMPTAVKGKDLVKVAKALGYAEAYRAEDMDGLDKLLKKAKEACTLTFIEVRCAIGAREDLGRPTTTALENKEAFMEYLREQE